jgi:hypothetical protein
MTNQIEYLTPGALRPWNNNARTHSKKQLKQIAESISRFGFTNPILIDDDNSILAGHGRVEAARLLEMETVPCLRQSQMSAEEKRAYVLADNKLALNAGWDDELLAKELGALHALDLDFDVEITGFTISEIDNLIDGLSIEEAGDPKDDQVPEDPPARCQPGDLWQLGTHRLICGNTLDPEVVDELMDGQLAKMVFTDPPYNVPIDGHVGNSGKVKHREFAMAAPVCRVCDFCLIFVPFGHYDELEILSYAIPLICSIGADVRQFPLADMLNISRASVDVAAWRPNSPEILTILCTNSALLSASRSLSYLILSSSPVRQWPPNSRHHLLTSNWCRAMPAAVQVEVGRTSWSSDIRNSKSDRLAGKALGIPMTNWIWTGSLSNPRFTKLAAL